MGHQSPSRPPCVLRLCSRTLQGPRHILDVLLGSRVWAEGREAAFRGERASNGSHASREGGVSASSGTTDCRRRRCDVWTMEHAPRAPNRRLPARKPRPRRCLRGSGTGERPCPDGASAAGRPQRRRELRGELARLAWSTVHVHAIASRGGWTWDDRFPSPSSIHTLPRSCSGIM